MACGNKTKNTCGEKGYATCVYYELEVPTFSSLIAEDCITVEETIDDIYELVKDVLNQINTDDLLNPYTGEDGKVYVKHVLLKQEEEINTLKDQIATLQTEGISEMLIADWGLTFPPGCLTLPCANPITTVKDLFQALINKDCNS